jgi:hypothetical protein
VLRPGWRGPGRERLAFPGAARARTAKVRATVADAPAARRRGEGTPGCGQRVMLIEGSGMAGWSRVAPPFCRAAGL